jgi:hypothetical protein
MQHAPDATGCAGEATLLHPHPGTARFVACKAAEMLFHRRQRHGIAISVRAKILKLLMGQFLTNKLVSGFHGNARIVRIAQET